ncbi:hypothetical protein Zmor_007634 [Zophobas morio]|uniref:Odorant receptor n=1 Tax=Zophobas morio TaxID=2755281 RepID=A0AA38IX45_9CUCU|nr:hypothetical protein Zmor_007634 [Zophobas morio]
MSKFDWKAATRINTLMLKMVGLWPRGDGAYTFNVYTLYAFISINLLVNGHTFFQAMNIFFVYSNLEALTATIFVTSSEFLAAVKIYYYVQNLKLLKKLKMYLDSDLFQPKSENQRLLVQPSLKMWRATYFGFWISSAATMTLWSVFPILDQTIKEYRLPFSAWYPYNTRMSPLYEITYIYQVMGIWFLATANLNIDTLISALMMYVGAQCEILCEELRTLKSDNSNIHEKIIMCIKHHQEVLDFAKGCNTFFDLMVLGQFFTSAMSNAVTMFRLTVVRPLSSEFYSLLFFVGSITTQLFLYCWFGNELEFKVRLNKTYDIALL